MNKLKGRKQYTIGDMTRVKHNRLDPNGRKARHFSETGALALLSEMEVDPGNQAHARVSRHASSHIQDSCMMSQTYKVLETETG